MKVYTGIGSRETPLEIILFMEAVALNLARKDWTLRSGCAPGADSAFERGAFDAWLRDGGLPMPELYLPWSGFERRDSDRVTKSTPQPEAYPIAKTFHPHWRLLRRGARALHARNVHQILGPDVTAPVLTRFVICWTKGGLGGGGTGQALRIATHYNVPIFDLAKDDALLRVSTLLVG